MRVLAELSPQRCRALRDLHARVALATGSGGALSRCWGAREMRAVVVLPQQREPANRRRCNAAVC